MKKQFIDQQTLQGNASNRMSFLDQMNNGQNNVFIHPKIKFMKNVFFVAMMLCVSVFFLTGCQQEEIIVDEISQQYDKRVYELSKDPEVQAELQFMKDHLGEDLSKITIIQMGEWKGDYVQHDGTDAVIIPRSGITESLQIHLKEGVNTSQVKRHRKHDRMATSGAKGIRYLTINGTGVPTTWRTATNNARVAWNNLGRSLTFNSPVSGSSVSSNTVNVSYQSLSALFGPSHITSTAISRLPGAGETIGSQLIINSDMDAAQNLTARQQTFVMAHELGHSIGFRHTDSSDGTLVYTGNWVCDGSADSKSVMRPGTSPIPSWPTSGTGFSLCDQLAFSAFYWLA